MSSIEWVEPPPPRAGSGRGSIFSGDVVAALKARPGKWACVARSHKSSTVATRFAQRHPEFETTTRYNPDKTFDLYARFVGEQS